MVSHLRMAYAFREILVSRLVRSSYSRSEHTYLHTVPIPEKCCNVIILRAGEMTSEVGGDQAFQGPKVTPPKTEWSPDLAHFFEKGPI